MVLRALLAFLALPGLVAGVLPWVIAQVAPWGVAGAPVPGGLVYAAGFAAVAWCARDFYVSGKGTLAPWSPPERLVIVGFYRFVRNPMYVAVVTALIGAAITTGTYACMAYAAAIAVGFHVRVVSHEEPWLARVFPEDWRRYRANVPRWIPRLSPWIDATDAVGMR